jgi:hypothetical protein
MTFYFLIQLSFTSLQDTKHYFVLLFSIYYITNHHCSKGFFNNSNFSANLGFILAIFISFLYFCNLRLFYKIPYILKKVNCIGSFVFYRDMFIWFNLQCLISIFRLAYNFLKILIFFPFCLDLSSKCPSYYKYNYCLGRNTSAHKICI